MATETGWQNLCDFIAEEDAALAERMRAAPVIAVRTEFDQSPRYCAKCGAYNGNGACVPRDAAGRELPTICCECGRATLKQN